MEAKLAPVTQELEEARARVKEQETLLKKTQEELVGMEDELASIETRAIAGLIAREVCVCVCVCVG